MFKHWFRDSFPNLKVPTKNELKEDLLLRWKDALTKDGKFIGYREKSALEVEKKEDSEDKNNVNSNEEDEEDDEEDKENNIEQHNSHQELYDNDDNEESVVINRDDTDDDMDEYEESLNIKRDATDDEDDLEHYLNN